MSACQQLSQIVDLDDLPSPPSVAAKLLEIFSDPSLKVMDLVKTLSADPILSARIIAYSNSPTISVRREVVHLKQAVVVLGMRMVKTIALSFSIIETGRDKQAAGIDLDDFWNKSLVRAVATKHLCSFSSQDADVGFLAGLMMEIGELVVAFSPKSKAEIVESFPDFKVKHPFEFKNDDELDQYRLGGLMLQNWMFPQEIIGALSPLCSEEQTTELQKSMMLATGLCEVICNPDYEADQIQRVKDFASDQFKIDDEMFQSIFDGITTEWKEYASLLHFDSASKSLSDIERDSKKQITSMSLELHRENSQMSEENEQLREQVNVDELTGLENRRSWEEKSRVEWERAYRNNTPFTIMIVDIDQFKIFNDTHGHAVGDQVLKHVAAMLNNNVRKYDEVFRIGGEEFMLLLPQCELPVAMKVAERLRKSICETSIQVDDKQLNVAVSIGVAQWDSNRKQTVEELFNEADQQLYRAKDSGRNRVCVSERFKGEVPNLNP